MINYVHIFFSASLLFCIKKTDNSIETSSRTQWMCCNLWNYLFVFVSRIVDSDNRVNFVYAFWYESVDIFVCIFFSFFVVDETKKLLRIGFDINKIEPLAIGFVLFFLLTFAWCEIVSIFKQLDNFVDSDRWF